MSGKLVLALDNSLDFLNVALGEDSRLIEERHARADRHPSEVLPLIVAHLLGDHGYAAADLSLLLVTLGPGSFTGVRVGLAFSKGLAQGLAIPLTGVPTLDVLAYPFSYLEGHYLCPLVDAKKGEVFHALYRVSGGKTIRMGDIQSLRPDDLAPRMPSPCLCFGSGVKLCRDVLGRIKGIQAIEGSFERVSGEALLKMGIARHEQGVGADALPIYGRKSEAEIKFNVDIS